MMSSSHYLCRQRFLCRTYPDVMVSVVRGAKMGVRECQRQFRRGRWNCTTSRRDSSVFGKLMLQGTALVIHASIIYTIKQVVAVSVYSLISPSVSHVWVCHCVGVPGGSRGWCVYLKKNRNSQGGGDITKERMWTFDVDYVTRNNRIS